MKPVTQGFGQVVSAAPTAELPVWRLVPQQFPGAEPALPITEIPLPSSGVRAGAAAGPRAPGALPGSCLHTHQGAG